MLTIPAILVLFHNNCSPLTTGYYRLSDMPLPSYALIIYLPQKMANSLLRQADLHILDLWGDSLSNNLPVYLLN